MDDHYRVMKCISKLTLNRNYKVYRNGTVTLGLWDGETMPRVDTPIHVGKSLSMWFQSSGDVGLLCHIITTERDISKVQQLLVEDITKNDVVFDSEIDDINTRLVSMYIFINDNISRTSAIASLSALAMNMVMENKNNLNNESIEIFNTWNKLEKSIRIFKTSQEELDKMNNKDGVIAIRDESRGSINYQQIAHTD